MDANRPQRAPEAPSQRLRDARLAAGMSQAEVARIVGTTQATVARHEALGVSPLDRARAVFDKYAAAVGLTAVELFEGRP